MARRDRKTFEDTLAEVRATPQRGPRVPAGRHAEFWDDPEGYRYSLVTDNLRPQEAVELVRGGAWVVYDQCGCGGAECALDWLSSADRKRIADAGPPDLLPSKHGRAELEHWRRGDDKDLVVVAVEVSWGDRIRG